MNPEKLTAENKAQVFISVLEKFKRSSSLEEFELMLEGGAEIEASQMVLRLAPRLPKDAVIRHLHPYPI